MVEGGGEGDSNSEGLIVCGTTNKMFLNKLILSEE